MVSAFSKIGNIDDLDDDEEEERQRISERARQLYNAAQDAYHSKCSSEDTVKNFQAAEAAMKPLLSNGLAGLTQHELEFVLKGRLHQAVATAHLEDLPDRWVKVKSLSEDVLQFDFNNAHARWMRGLSLLHGFKRLKEAEEECRRAAECARIQGRDSEALKWEDEIRRSFEEAVEDGVSEVASEAAKVPPEAAASSSSSQRKEPKGTSEKQKPSSSFQKGFFNKPGKKEQPPPSASPPAAELPNDLKAESQRELRKLQEQMQKQEQIHREEVSKLLREQQAQRQNDQQRLQEGLDAVAQEFEHQLSQFAQGGSAASNAFGSRAKQVQEKIEGGKAWTEKELCQRHSDFATEVLTLQKMTEREFRDRQDSSQKLSSDLRSLSKRFEHLRKSTKSVEEYIRSQSAIAEEEDLKEHGIEDLADTVTNFGALPTSEKLAAMLDDGALLRVFLLVAVIGMLFALGVFVEVFAGKSCRLICSPR
eukprot:TRINITY_DN80011_c0_g1_i1.p1 TRINITY_DN80011_c0_g1~~TRINITY_DN80011_c0_g1_i1.p1  ORF type:complete len:488 (+),score=133.29 TRINITY_DN80011_c0_g1_i1:31-1464(+)